MTADYYFAYGSNMNPSRVEHRDMAFVDHVAGVLIDYQLCFNKQSQKYPGAASANVMRNQDGSNEGVLYRLQTPGEIERMDPYEGYPIHYDRVILPIRSSDGICKAWVYTTNAAYIAEGLQPAQWYLDHLLAGAPFLTSAYVAMLRRVECVENSLEEPL